MGLMPTVKPTRQWVADDQLAIMGQGARRYVGFGQRDRPVGR